MIINNACRDNLVATNSRPDLGPADPIEATKEQDTHSDNGEDVVRVPIGIPVPVGRDEGCHRQEDVGQEIKDRDG